MGLGEKIRARRRQLGLTLQEVGKRAGLSAAFLSQVERNLATPSMSSLVSLSRALDVSIEYFIDPPQEHDSVRKREEIRFFTLDGSKVQYARLSGSLAEQKLDAVFVRIPPGYSSESIRHAGEEFVYILKGHLKIKIGSKEYLLGPGDSAHFNSSEQHRWGSVGDEEVELVWVGTPPLFR